MRTKILIGIIFGFCFVNLGFNFYLLNSIKEVKACTEEHFDLLSNMAVYITEHPQTPPPSLDYKTKERLNILEWENSKLQKQIKDNEMNQFALSNRLELERIEQEREQNKINKELLNFKKEQEFKQFWNY